jgi:dihydroneopterin aldolase
MDKISVKGLKFFAFHGCHPLEAKTGGEFEVDILIETDFKSAIGSDSIDCAIDYVMLMEVAKEQMRIRCNLIETVAHNILCEIQKRITTPHKLWVTVHKLKAPVEYDLQRVSVTVESEHGMNK